jgi:transcriptional regulator with XRE-family HTH domain
MPNLGSWFRARREERGCTLDEIAARTRIPRRLLVELERDSFEHWPASRVYRIGFLKAYATAIGLDPAATDIDGELRIDSIPSGTHVVVNGIARGATPVRLRYLPIGSYRIRLVRDGYESKETLATITNEQPVRSISITLRERLP